MRRFQPPRPHGLIESNARSRNRIQTLHTYPETRTTLPSISVYRPMKHPVSGAQALQPLRRRCQLSTIRTITGNLGDPPFATPATPATGTLPHTLLSRLSACNALSPSSVKPNVQTSLLTSLHASPASLFPPGRLRPVRASSASSVFTLPSHTHSLYPTNHDPTPDR